MTQAEEPSDTPTEKFFAAEKANGNMGFSAPSSKTQQFDNILTMNYYGVSNTKHDAARRVAKLKTEYGSSARRRI